MSFADDLKRFNDKLERDYSDVFVNTVTECKRSIVEGSEITAASGQPVDTGHLRASWYERFESPQVAIIATNTEYAPEIEDNSRGATLRSKVGGFHSVALTRAGFARIVEFARRLVTGLP